MSTAAVAQEHRRFPRSEFPPRVGVNFVQPQVSSHVDGVNVSQGGLRLRLREMLDIHAMVRLQLTPTGKRPVECAGRVSWISQRLDLRPRPPFLFDIGIEFIKPSPTLRQLLKTASRA